MQNYQRIHPSFISNELVDLELVDLVVMLSVNSTKKTTYTQTEIFLKLDTCFGLGKFKTDSSVENSVLLIIIMLNFLYTYIEYISKIEEIEDVYDFMGFKMKS